MPESLYSSVGSTSSSLLERVKASDEDAWRRLVRLYGALVLYWCRKSGLQVTDRNDVFQDTFRSVARHIAEFRHDRPEDSFRGWLRTITLSKIRDHFRQAKRELPAAGGTDAYEQLLQAADAADGPDVEIELVLKQALAMVEAEFEPRTWRAFWRVTADGLSTDAVAEELGMSTAAVRQAKSRVLRRLRQELDGF
jgi:RNA polymerase sigma-70 factor (ECF subfamily)